MKKILLVLFSLLFIIKAFAQQPDKIYMPSIHSVKLFVSGNQSAYPIIQLNSSMSLELHFDDLSANVKKL